MNVLNWSAQMLNCSGLRFNKRLYMAKVIDAASIHTSPMAKEIFKSLERVPLVISKATPTATSMMPKPLLTVINSRKKMRDSMTMKMGNVMAINERLIAEVV